MTTISPLVGLLLKEQLAIDAILSLEIGDRLTILTANAARIAYGSEGSGSISYEMGKIFNSI